MLVLDIGCGEGGVVVESIVYRSIVVSQWRVLHTGCVGLVGSWRS